MQPNGSSRPLAERNFAPTGAPDHRPQSPNSLDELLSDALTLAEAAHVLPGRPHPSTFWRWRKKGLRGIKLKTVQIGGRVWVTRSAISDFLSALSDSRQVPPAQPDANPSLDPPQRRSVDTNGRLTAAGLLRRELEKRRPERHRANL